MVLRTWKLGEAGRTISLFTRGHGRVRAVAKGIRKTDSRFSARPESSGHVDVQLAEGRGSLETIAQVESLHPSMLGADYECFRAAQVLAEIADRLVFEDAVLSLTQYRPLLRGPLALRRDELPTTVVVDSYLFRRFVSASWTAVVDACANRGATEQLRWFFLQLGEVVCPACRLLASASADPGLLALFGALPAGRWEDIRTIERSLRGWAYKVVSTYATWHLDRSPRSLSSLRTS